MSECLRLFSQEFENLIQRTNSKPIITYEEFDFNQLINYLEQLDILNKLQQHLSESMSSEEAQSIDKIKTLLDKLFTIARIQDFLSDELSYFIVNLHLSEFIHTHFPREMEQYTSILMKISIYNLVEDSYLSNLLDDSLSSKSRAWLSTNILINTAHNFNVSTYINMVNPKNHAKFQKLLQENSDFTNIICLMTLFKKLKVDHLFLAGLPQSFLPMDQIKYITNYNPSFRNLISCSITSKAIILPDCPDCFIQPKESKSLVLWMNDKKSFIPCLINLHTLSNYLALSDSTLRIKFECMNSRRTRSGSLSNPEYLQSFSIVKERTEFLTDIEIELKLQQQSQFNWLVSYLSQNKSNKTNKTRKISINSLIHVSESQVMPDTNETTDSLVTDEVITSSVLTRTNSTDTHSAEITSLEKNEETVPKRSPVRSSGSIRKRPKSSVKTPQNHLKSELAKYRGIDQAKEMVQPISTQDILLATNSQVSKRLNNYNLPGAANKQLPISTVSDEICATSTANNTILPREFTDIDLNQTTCPTIGSAYDVMNESLKLLSSNLINKLKSLEFNILKKQNQLQQELDNAFAKIEHQHKIKLQEIQQYYKQECEKILK
ncbi:uncharacterized protein SPAPADRAFT_68915 [Spathaspora passalidarum NRRL Y-27907]|uniref:Uncharacterized protein n=1 Tax=Spathaspora passalidarum (strain NRRL Y-27907 / 11-Y1) TaxID=619300 RepID=G3AV15_SPAPN|nr:uncharacterized protein SPAPADRAFT_68915 [Spathaspora passalidarum NRRL Y-27907]EGW30088.1 hypothetical protein SPAPADRAFT_68915 [Spathaspora passalidarum NRRL Y-27907]